MPMGVLLRVAKFSGDAFLETLGDEMLQALGLIVQFVDGVVQNLVEKGLDQPMMTNNLEGTSFSNA